MSGEEFWDLAPCELAREFESALLRRQDDAERDLVMAWQTAVFATQAFNGKLDDLKTLLARRRGHRVQSRADQRQALMTLSKQYGIPLREKVH